MKLTTKGKYGLYAMLFLSRHEGEGPQPLSSMEGLGVQPDYLEQLLGTLRRGGLVTTVRGSQGGYQLSRPSDEITVGDVIVATEGPVNLSECLSDEESCVRSNTCASRKAWSYLSRQINRVLDSVTLRDVISGQMEEPEEALTAVPSLLRREESR